MTDRINFATGETFSELVAAVRQADLEDWPLNGRYLQVGERCDLWNTMAGLPPLSGSPYLLGIKIAIQPDDDSRNWQLFMPKPTDTDQGRQA